MKKLAVTAILLFAFAYSRAQYSDVYGQVSLDELSMTEYPLDKEAEALVIFDQGYYRFEREENGNSVYFELNMTVHSKIKILHEAGLEYANLEIPYYYEAGSPNNMEWVTVEGTVYNMVDDQVVKTPLGNSHIFEENPLKNRFLKKVAFPNVQVGSVIEYTYTIRTRRFFNLRPWHFQRTIPVRSSILTYRAGPFYEYAFILKGASKFDVRDYQEDVFDTQFLSMKYRNVTYKFGMNNLTAFRDEEFLPNTNDYMATLYFEMAKYYVYSTGLYQEVMSTWPGLCGDLMKDADFGKYVASVAKDGGKLLPLLGLEGKTELEKLKIITDYVKGMYSWNKYYSIFASKKSSALAKEKTGTVGDINLYLIGLLKAAGLNAEPVVLSVRSSGRIYKAYPFLSFFNYVIGKVEIDGKSYFVDGVNPLTKFDEVSPECANVEGLVVAKSDKEQWVPILQNKISTEHNQADIVIQPETGDMTVELTRTTQGNHALEERTKYNGIRENLKGPYQRHPGAVLKEASAENFQQTDKPFITRYRYEITGGESSPGKIILNPLQHLAPADNPFKQSSRRHPVDLEYAISESFTAKVHIPEGYRIEYLPKSTSENGGGMKYSYSAVVDSQGKVITVTGEYSLANFFEPSVYFMLKGFYGEIVNKFSDAIVFARTAAE